MRVTTFIAGLAIGALGGMYLADRRSLSHLQSKIQLAGDVVSDVVGMAKGKVMDTAFATMTGSNSHPSSTPSHSHAESSQSQVSVTNGQSHAGSSGASSSSAHSTRDSINLERVKELIERDPELKRQVDAIIHESSAGGKSQAEHVSVQSKTDAAKGTSADRSKSSTSSNSHSHH